AKELSAKEKPMGTFKDFMMTGITFGAPALVTLAQGETGTVIVMGFMFLVMIFFAGVDIRIVLSLVFFVLLAVGFFFGYALLSGSTDYRVLRIISFLDPQQYRESAGYQILYSQMAIGSGGLRGIGQFVIGSISQLDYVPEDHTDFIFSTIGESSGFIGCCFILFLYLILLLRMLYLARYTLDKFGRLIIIGVMAMFFLHIFENVAMTVGLMPITGIPLPFISYGGSNFMTNIIGIALVCNVVKNRSMTSQLLYQTMVPTRKRAKKRRIRQYDVS
ncbi:MAG: FtsW/RodA/SpoVE family cell cycle protein, partial [Clostridia bacterium]|nr:FtsW/RodA/SpoVE family cell cycle protein [Clostridia bacterium]